jgi:hypothetical protein
VRAARNVVDSSAWLEYFADAPAAGFFAPAIEDAARLVVPTLSLHEVFKRLLQQRGDGAGARGDALDAGRGLRDPAGRALPPCRPALTIPPWPGQRSIA